MPLAVPPQYVNQSSFFEFLSIPPHKPDLVRVLGVSVIPEVLSFDLIKTPVGHSYEGQHLTGLTLLVHCNLTEKLSYIANTADDSVHSIYYTYNKSIAVALPTEIDSTPTQTLIDLRLFSITPSIACLYNRSIDARTVYQTALLFVYVTLGEI